MEIKVQYLKDVTAPKIIAGKKGEKKLLLPQHARQLEKSGYVKILESSTNESKKPVKKSGKNPVRKRNSGDGRQKNSDSIGS